MAEDELIRKYAREIERIIEGNTMGDFTWEGLLFSFLREVDESRTLKYEVQTEEGDTVHVYAGEEAPVEDEENRYYDIHTLDEKLGWTLLSSRLSYEIASKIVRSLADDVSYRLVDHGDPLPGKKTLYNIEHKPDDEWMTYRRDLSFKQARDIVQSFVWESEVRIVPAGEREPELLYDVVVVVRGADELYASKVSLEDAQVYLKEAPWWQAPRIELNKDSDPGKPERPVNYDDEEYGPIYDGDDVPDGCDKW